MRSTLALALIAACSFPACAPAGDSDAVYADKMAQEHEGDEPVAGAAAGDPAQGEVTAMEVQYWPGHEITGYFAQPTSPTRSAVIVIQEWWGLNENIQTMVRRFAEAGHVALAVDLYDGNVATTRDEAMALMTGAMEQPEALKENLRAAHAHLAAVTGVETVGSVGWCFGGGWSLQTAIMMGDDLDAAVIYYGRVASDDQLATIEAPVLGHFASEDGGIPVAGVRAFEAKMKELGKDVTVHVYDGAHHAFANPSGTHYDAEAAEAAWTRTLDFLAANLGG